jgi:hypothetical protein
VDVSRRGFLLTATAAAVPSATVDPGPYGSGYLGDWTGTTPVQGTTAELLAALGNPDGIYLVGDSIVARAFAQVRDYLTTTRGYPTGIRCRQGAPMSDGVQWLIDAHHGGSGLPPTIVLAMGANDVMQPPACYAQLDRLIDDIGPTRHLYVVAPFAARSAYFGYDVGNSARITAREYALALSNPGVVRVVDWHSRVFDNPRSNIPGWLIDGVHPNATGINVWLSLIGNAVDAGGVGTLPGGDPHG